MSAGCPDCGSSLPSTSASRVRSLRATKDYNLKGLLPHPRKTSEMHLVHSEVLLERGRCWAPGKNRVGGLGERSNDCWFQTADERMREQKA